MPPKTYFTTMARYNRWMNGRVYACCAELSDEERKKDRGAFFESIHGTLNHIILGDLIWIGRFTGKAFTDFSGLVRELLAPGAYHPCHSGDQLSLCDNNEAPWLCIRA